MVQSINNMAKGKGYKLTSATGDGTPKTCAFFFSDQGCRNGDACKFSHTQEPAATTTCPSATASVSSSSVCSSESDESDDGEIIEKKAGAYASLANGEVDIRKQAPVCVNPFLTAVAQPTSTTTQTVTPESLEATLSDKSWVLVSLDKTANTVFINDYPSPVDLCKTFEIEDTKKNKDFNEMIFSSCIQKARQVYSSSLRCIVSKNNRKEIDSFGLEMGQTCQEEFMKRTLEEKNET